MNFWEGSRNARKNRGRMDQIDQVLQHIQERKNFLVTSHARPDGDDVVFALALAEILRKMGKNAAIILGDGVPVIYKPLPQADSIIHSSQATAKEETAII